MSEENPQLQSCTWVVFFTCKKLEIKCPPQKRSWLKPWLVCGQSFTKISEIDITTQRYDSSLNNAEFVCFNN